MGHEDVILGHNVEYRGSVSVLPILLLQCSKGSQLKRVTEGRGLKFGFWRRQKMMKLPGNFMSQSSPPDPPPPFISRGINPLPSGTVRKDTRIPCLG